jgi:hypothetical protein
LSTAINILLTKKTWHYFRLATRVAARLWPSASRIRRTLAATATALVVAIGWIVTAWRATTSGGHFY